MFRFLDYQHHNVFDCRILFDINICSAASAKATLTLGACFQMFRCSVLVSPTIRASVGKIRTSQFLWKFQSLFTPKFCDFFSISGLPTTSLFDVRILIDINISSATRAKATWTFEACFQLFRCTFLVSATIRFFAVKINTSQFLWKFDSLFYSYKSRIYRAHFLKHFFEKVNIFLDKIDKYYSQMFVSWQPYKTARLKKVR